MICNSTPLICLAKLNQLNLLQKLFKYVIIPESVKKEVIVEDKPDSMFIKKAIEEGWIKVEDPSISTDLSLGDGETAAISLAKEKKEALIIDDALATKAAQSFGIDCIRTTTLIFMALKKKIIDKKQAISLINKLISNGYYISPEFYAQILNKLIE